MNLSFSEIVVNDVKGSQRKAFIEIKSIDHKNRSDAFYPYFFLIIPVEVRLLSRSRLPSVS